MQLPDERAGLPKAQLLSICNVVNISNRLLAFIALTLSQRVLLNLMSLKCYPAAESEHLRSERLVLV